MEEVPSTHRHEDKILLILTLIIGAVVGLAVVLFIVLTENLGGKLYPAASPAWRRIFIPIAGSLISGYLLYRYFPNARGSGIPQTKTALFLRDGQISFRTVLGKFGLCSLSLASGIALGREGPSVHVGAGIASTLGRKLRLSTAAVKSLVPTGASAALAAAFNTPISAVLFSLEEVMGDMHAPVLGSIVLASATSWIVLHLILGDEPLFHVPSYQLVHPIEFVFYAALGLIGGFVSVGFVKLLLWQRRFFLRVPKRFSWIMPGVGGVTVGLLGWFYPEVLGVGYSYVGKALNGQMVVGAMALLVVLKIVATATCYSSGNAGGIFGPSLFIGAMMGGAVGGVAHLAMPDYTGSVGAYALVGMGAAFAGIVRVPLTSVIMIFEITRDYSIIVPLMISNLMSYFISSRLQEEPIYEALQHQDGIHLPAVRTATAMITEAELAEAPSIDSAAPLDAALQRFTADRVKVLRVVSPGGAPVGAIAQPEIAAASVEASGPHPGQNRLLAGMSAALIAVALLATFLTYYFRAERTRRADHAFQMANELYEKDRLPEAIEQYRYALSISHRTDHRLALGVALVKAERMNEATIYLNEVLRQHPNSAPGRLALAHALAGEGRPDDAVQQYRRAILGAWDDHPAENRFRARAELIDLLTKNGKTPDARAELLALAADLPPDSALQKQAARMLLDHGLSREAADLYRRMISSGPPDASEYDGLGEALFASADYQGADAAYRKALATDAADTVAAHRSELAGKILALDPDRRGIGSRERYRRTQEILGAVVDRVTACAEAGPDVTAAQTALARKKAPPSFADAADENLDLARRLWSERPADCKPPTDDPAVLLLAHARS
jgi:CIC family chloride channel protein